MKGVKMISGIWIIELESYLTSSRNHQIKNISQDVIVIWKESE